MHYYYYYYYYYCQVGVKSVVIFINKVDMTNDSEMIDLVSYLY